MLAHPTTPPPLPSTGLLAAFLALLLGSVETRGQDFTLLTFERQRLTDRYLSEGANAGDINGDGHLDVVHGPYWFEGPTFAKQHEIYPARDQPRERYADNFFNWIYDFNGDGGMDVLVVGFPGTPAYVYENPGKGNFGKHWKKHTVLKSVANESPQLLNVVGDERPELLCTSGGQFGFATVNWDNPFSLWTFHAISVRPAPNPFGHGLGCGDVNGDGRTDILIASGWFEQPAEAPMKARWEFHETPFTNSYGGAEMHVYDVDGDGYNDVITSLAAHDFGLAWYRQERQGTRITFRQHLILGARPEQSRYGLVFSELHSVALVDMDGDGLKDIVTGKTYYSHHQKSPLWDAGAVVYWFRLVRTPQGVDWVPYRADGEAGIGRQISIADVNGDRLPDIVVGGMVGAHVLLQRRQKVTEEQWKAAQPKVLPTAATSSPRAPRSVLDPATGRAARALEGEELAVLAATGNKPGVQEMKRYRADAWSGGKQLVWRGGTPGARLDLELPVANAGKQQLLAVFTMAPDYGMVQVYLDDKPLGDVLDLFNFPEVLTTGVVRLGTLDLQPGKHRLSLEIKGAHPSAVKSYLVGLDYLLLEPAP